MADRSRARRLAAELTQRSEELFDEVRRGRLSPDEVKAILVTVAHRHAEKLELTAVVERSFSEVGPMSGRRADQINGAIYRLLAEQGRDASLADDGDLLRACGLDLDEGLQVRTTLEFYRASKLVPPNPVKLFRLIREHAPEVEQGAMALAQAEHAFYRGRPPSSIPGRRSKAYSAAPLALGGDFSAKKSGNPAASQAIAPLYRTTPYELVGGRTGLCEGITLLTLQRRLLSSEAVGIRGNLYERSDQTQ